MPIAIGIHGGCGTLDRTLMSEAEWAEARAHLADSLKAGWAVLAAGRPRGRCGRGRGRRDGGFAALQRRLRRGADRGRRPRARRLDHGRRDARRRRACRRCARVRNPVRAARAVMERSDCVLIDRRGGRRLRGAHGLAMVENGYFTTAAPRSRRSRSLKARARRRHDPDGERSGKARHGRRGRARRTTAISRPRPRPAASTTSRAAGSATAPVIGAGTYAQNGVCAVSCTGQGEFFIRHAAAYDIAARMQYAGATLQAGDRRASSTRP